MGEWGYSRDGCDLVAGISVAWAGCLFCILHSEQQSYEATSPTSCLAVHPSCVTAVVL
jgi:hypothetical protein